MKNKDNYEKAFRVKLLVDKYMTWTSDKVAFDKNEHWTSWAKEILDLEKTKTVKNIKDDCDGFALTSAALLYYNGVLRENIGIGLCQTETDEYHLVCFCYDGPTTWVLDNREIYVKPKHKMSGYKWISEMKYDSIGEWVKSKYS